VEWPFYSKLAVVISTVLLPVKTRPWSDGLEFSAAWPPTKVTIRAIDAECPKGRSLVDYRLGHVYWLAWKLGVLRDGIEEPATFAELKRSVYVVNSELTSLGMNS